MPLGTAYPVISSDILINLARRRSSKTTTSEGALFGQKLIWMVWSLGEIDDKTKKIVERSLWLAGCCVETIYFL
jgi:hypothetical protein